MGVFLKLGLSRSTVAFPALHFSEQRPLMLSLESGGASLPGKGGYSS